MKKCGKCNKDKPETEFHKNKLKKDGLDWGCKTCKAKYAVWNDMMCRCYNVNHKNYKDYGGRGITVCDEWQSYKGMKDWIGTYWVKGLQLDRINNDKGYSHDNCRFVTPGENLLNKRVTGDIKYRGVCFCKHAKKYKAQTDINGKRKHIGYYNTAIKAARAYDVYVISNNLLNQLNNIGENNEK